MAQFLEILHQSLAITPVGLNEFIMGLCFGWPAPTLYVLESPGSQIHLNSEQSAWIGSLFDFGRIFGPIISAGLLDVVGRRVLQSLCAIIACFAWLLIVLYKTVWAIYLLLFLSGISMGMKDVASSIYLAEVTSPSFRGVYCGVIMVASYLGELIEFIIATYLSYDTVALINTSISIVGFISIFLLIESPQFLLMKGKIYEAQKIYKWLKGTEKWDDINQDFEEIRQNVEKERIKKKSLRRLLGDKANRESIKITFIMNILTVATGFAAITSFASKIFSLSEILSPNEFTIMFGIAQIIASFTTMFIIERFNRRTLLLTGYFLSAILHATSATLYYVNDNVTPNKNFPWLIFLSVTLYTIIYAVIYPVVHIIRGELFPQSIKAVGGSLGIMIHASMAFTTARIFIPLVETFGMYSNFVLYTIVSLVALAFTYFKLPETRGRTLVDIQTTIS